MLRSGAGQIVAKETGRTATVDADLQTLRALATEHMNAARPDLAARTWTSYVGMWDRNVGSTTSQTFRCGPSRPNRSRTSAMTSARQA